jgi:hypothetical protein
MKKSMEKQRRNKTMIVIGLIDDSEKSDYEFIFKIVVVENRIRQIAKIQEE